MIKICKAMCPKKGEQREYRQCTQKATQGVLCGRHAHLLYLAYPNPFSKSRWLRRHAEMLTEVEISTALTSYQEFRNEALKKS
tara:strand:- start:908 stop:1156 length:249 start_codon:yes stop_codon:yes gene_type:complete